MRIFTVYLLLNSIFTVQATRITSATNDRDTATNQYNGALQKLPKVIVEGATALNMTHINYISDKVGDLIELQYIRNDFYRLGDEGFYGFTFQLHSGWETLPGLIYHLARFDADVSDIGCNYWIYMPYTMFWVRDNQLHAGLMTGTPCSPRIVAFSNLATVPTGEWHKVVIQAKWRADETGYFKIWFDGVNVLRKYDLSTTLDDERVFRFVVGE
ncbi:polysaccharide lyase [Aspergillus leporis]|jgi:hypothetical protein|uniref:Polysaccharide lyase n=1 Tax=Aspergillus leporis TaxID=41062 RepID=A0A5N5WKC3_9EURO|nr:polysaccharide lyase [Aspergillus leporis]